jgi:hypothetical protein
VEQTYWLCTQSLSDFCDAFGISDLGDAPLTVQFTIDGTGSFTLDFGDAHPPQRMRLGLLRPRWLERPPEVVGQIGADDQTIRQHLVQACPFPRLPTMRG